MGAVRLYLVLMLTWSVIQRPPPATSMLGGPKAVPLWTREDGRRPSARRPRHRSPPLGTCSLPPCPRLALPVHTFGRRRHRHRLLLPMRAVARAVSPLRCAAGARHGNEPRQGPDPPSTPARRFWREETGSRARRTIFAPAFAFCWNRVRLPRR